ncbi:MAG: hypothetical protein ACW976_06770, partial [Candidatus Ranarchaeia archaeon]
GIIGLATFPIFGLIGFSLPLPQSYSGGFGVWLLGSGIVTLLVLFGITRKKQWSRDVWESFGVDSKDLKNTLTTFSYHALLALAVVGWLILWVYLIDWIFIIDFRAYIPVLKNLTLLRALMIPIFFAFSLPFFLIEGIWITGILRPMITKTKVTSYMKWGVKITLTKLLPYLILFAAQYLPTLIWGDLLIPGFIGFLLLFLFTSILLFGVTSLFLAWSVYQTGRVYSGAILSAILLSWSLVSILPFAF